ncbi:MAG: 3-dehydroquinate dehydratase / shikimate dehydrogenase [Acidobacteriota bacterium]|jgi:3-dehydroquinate dehydratase type I|nr:3-dehydroquinate dehydratase / shikimate dehydrogenase [Acidobacteriota bacterium]
MKLIVTIHEETPEAAIAAIGALSLRHDVVEVRFDAFGQLPYDFRPFREATPKPILATNRGGDHVDIARALGAGIDLVDVEWHEGLTLDGLIDSARERIVLSHHDWNGVPELAPLIDAMSAFGCAYTKIAVTPRTLRENELLLDAARAGLSIFGMGERGLYSRILAPFFGSELTFVAPDDAHVAAPGQLTLERALAIYGDGELPRVPKIFAIAGNPAGHSLSPSIHNPLFRERSVAAAYTIASFETFDEIAEAFLAQRITGLSVTAPFKEDAYRFAVDAGAEIRPNAQRAEAINTLVNTPRGILAENTDFDGLLELMPSGVKRAAVIGAGGTARAAIAALKFKNATVEVFNRTPRTILGCATKPLEEIARFDGDLIIDTLPGGVDVELPKLPAISAAYSRGGVKLLHAQAGPQHDIFLEAFK